MPESFDPEQESKFTLPKSVSDVIKTSSALQNKADNADTVTNVSVPAGSVKTSEGASGNLAWVGKSGTINPVASLVQLSLDPKAALGKIGELNDQLINIVNILETLLQIINTFQSDYNNLYKALQFLVKTLLQQVQDLIVSLSSTGIYILPLVPDMSPLNPDYRPGGGFPAFSKKINHALFNTQDPNRPVFNSKEDYVGGVVLALTAGSNYGSMIKDLRVLSKFVGGLSDQDKVSPPKRLQAIPGLYRLRDAADTYKKAHPEDDVGFFREAVAAPKAAGVKLIWDAPEGVRGIRWYKIYRSDSYKGSPVIDRFTNEQVRTPVAPDGSGGDLVFEYRDLRFNGGVPLIFDSDPESGGALEYLDFEVEQEATYFYKVVPVFEDPDKFFNGQSPNEFIEGSLASNIASAKVSVCLPPGVFSEFLETPDGIIPGIPSGSPPYWYNATLRQVLGPDLDQAFKGLTRMLNSLWGLVQTSNDHFNSFLDGVKDFLQETKQLIDLLQKVIAALEALKLSGSAIALSIPMEKGGVQGFYDRLNSANVPDSLKKELLGIDPDRSSADTASTYSAPICDIYGGFVLLMGIPSTGSFSSSLDIPQEQLDALGSTEAFKNTQAQYEAKKKQTEDLKEAIEKTLGFVAGLFGGGTD